MTKADDDERASVAVTLIDQGYDHQSWHGPNLRSSLRGVAPEEALWRPSAGRHNIWEIVLHCAYWKYVVSKRLSDSERTFSRSPADWPVVPEETTASAWTADRRFLAEENATLREVAATLTDSRLFDPLPGKSKHTRLDLIWGVAAHDIYHAGQIRLLRRMYAARAG